MAFDISPDERALREEFVAAPFLSQVGVRWGSPRIDWPHDYLWVRCRSIEGCPVERYWMRLNCSQFPGSAPTGTFWDMDADKQLERARRPWGTGEVALVFRMDWPTEAEYEGPGSALYSPIDRVGLKTHSNWAAECPNTAWSDEKGIVHYLNEVHRLLDSAEYTGPGCP